MADSMQQQPSPAGGGAPGSALTRASARMRTLPAAPCACTGAAGSIQHSAGCRPAPAGCCQRCRLAKHTHSCCRPLQGGALTSAQAAAAKASFTVMHTMTSAPAAWRGRAQGGGRELSSALHSCLAEACTLHSLAVQSGVEASASQQGNPCNACKPTASSHVSPSPSNPP